MARSRPAGAAGRRGRSGARRRQRPKWSRKKPSAIQVGWATTPPTGSVGFLGRHHNDGGRGVYFLDPSGHGMEIITRPYGGGPPLVP